MNLTGGTVLVRGTSSSCHGDVDFGLSTRGPGAYDAGWPLESSVGPCVNAAGSSSAGTVNDRLGLGPISSLMSMRGLGGIPGREETFPEERAYVLEWEDIPLPGRLGPTRVARGASSSESESESAWENVELPCPIWEAALPLKGGDMVGC